MSKPTNIQIKCLTGADRYQIQQLDKLSKFNVSDFLENHDDHEVCTVAFGLFENDQLIGYCTCYHADFHKHHTLPNWDAKSLVLSNLFIVKNKRHKGYAHRLVKHCSHRFKHKTLYLSCKQELKPFYEKHKFIDIENNIMCRIKSA